MLVIPDFKYKPDSSYCKLIHTKDEVDHVFTVYGELGLIVEVSVQGYTNRALTQSLKSSYIK